MVLRIRVYNRTTMLLFVVFKSRYLTLIRDYSNNFHDILSEFSSRSFFFILSRNISFAYPCIIIKRLAIKVKSLIFELRHVYMFCVSLSRLLLIATVVQGKFKSCSL